MKLKSDLAMASQRVSTAGPGQNRPVGHTTAAKNRSHTTAIQDRHTVTHAHLLIVDRATVGAAATPAPHIHHSHTQTQGHHLVNTDADDDHRLIQKRRCPTRCGRSLCIAERTRHLSSGQASNMEPSYDVRPI